MALTIIIAVVAAMVKDLRWLLIFALPFAAIAAWEFISYFTKSNRRKIWLTLITTILVAISLVGLYVRLKPPQQDTKQDTPPSGSPHSVPIPTPTETLADAGPVASPTSGAKSPIKHKVTAASSIKPTATPAENRVGVFTGNIFDGGGHDVHLNIKGAPRSDIENNIALDGASMNIEDAPDSTIKGNMVFAGGVHPPETYIFPTAVVGGSSSGVSINQTYNGPAAVVKDISFFGEDSSSFKILYTDCEAGTELASGDKINIQLLFSPTSAGAKQGKLQITTIDVNRRLVIWRSHIFSGVAIDK